MAEESQRIETLKKVTLMLELVGRGAASPEKAVSDAYEFIFGIGSGGLSPIEMALEGRNQGDRFTMSSKKNEWPGLFGHLTAPAFSSPVKDADTDLKIHVTRVEPAEQREIIQAMSATAACGADCCSGHQH
jgi:hypothetical protein